MAPPSWVGFGSSASSQPGGGEGDAGWQHVHQGYGVLQDGGMNLSGRAAGAQVQLPHPPVGCDEESPGAAGVVGHVVFRDGLGIGPVQPFGDCQVGHQGGGLWFGVVHRQLLSVMGQLLDDSSRRGGVLQLLRGQDHPREGLFRRPGRQRLQQPQRQGDDGQEPPLGV